MNGSIDLGGVVDAVLAALEAGEPAKARALVEQGLAHHGTAEPLWSLAGLCARLLGDADGAERCWRRCLDLQPTATVCLRLGDLLAAERRPSDAALCWRGAEWLDPGAAEASRRRLADALGPLDGDDAAIEALYARAADGPVTGPRILVRFGLLLAASGRRATAERAHRMAVALLPGDAAALTDLGLAVEAQGRLDEAEALQRRALALAPQSTEIMGHLADVLAARGDDAQAERLYRTAVALDPAASVMHSNLGVLLFDAARLDEAEAAFRTALALRPGARAPTLNLGQLLLATGRFAAGWALCDARYDADTAAALPGFPQDTGSCRRWRGEALAGKSLIVWAEQGLGDQLQFVRYLRAVRELGPQRLTLVCAPPLLRLFGRLDGPDAVVALSPDAAALLRAHDHWAPLLGLPLQCGAGVLAMQRPYLSAEPGCMSHWARRLPPRNGQRRIGLVWRGNPLHDNDRDRSLPDLPTLAPLWAVPGLQFIGLQKGAQEDVGRSPPPGQPLTHVGSDAGDFADTAAIVSGLDLLVCVDTAIAHLAGALGIACWVLIPARRCDWRWQRRHRDSAWYPTLRLFRQPARGDWATPVTQVVAALRAEVTTAPRPSEA